VTQVNVRSIVRFGSDFELDLEAHVLRRAHRVLKLERIPLDILQLLVLHAGEVVTREQIVQKVWGEGVSLDSDNSINGAIRKIRQVLKDNPEQPRFIQTITGTGYRFIATVSDPAADPPVPVATSGSAVLPAPDPVVPDIVVTRAQARPSGSRRWLAVVSVAAVGGLAILGAWLLWGLLRPAAPTGRMMLAVLPFENLTGDARQEYFSDGMTEEMIAQLGQFNPERLGVIARTSVMRFKHERQGLEEIGRELGVQYVLEGSVRRDSDRVRIAVQLIRVADQTHLWARQYDRERMNLLSVQAEIAHAVANEIRLTLSGDRSNPALDRTLSPQAYDAYDLYLQGRYFWNKRTLEGFKQAIGSFQAALAKDPGYARAYAGLADSYALMGTYGLAPLAEVLPKARAAAVRALEMDERLSEAHASLALIVQTHEWDWQRAEREFRRAIELDPNYVTAHHWYAEHLAFRGRFAEALAASERARQLDPLSLILAADYGAILYFSRQYDRAIEQFRAVLAVEPNFGRAHMIIGAYVQNGRLTDALTHVQNWQKVETGPWTWAWAAYVYGRAGRAADARRALEEMKAANRIANLDLPWLSAIAYAGLGQKRDVLNWLRRAQAERSNAILTLKVDPIFDGLREDPGFEDLLRRVGLAEAPSN
jgi:TolB-like protein/DNA-binding winged helix-turn-helix (wHTH) protein/Flp pilus assembly protein TadD